jgi:uncharacterized protein (TIGR02594 family)
MEITAFTLAQRFVGLREIPGKEDSPAVLAMLRLDAKWPEGDEVPWCSAFCNYIAWLLRLPRSKSLAARSWLACGMPVDLADASVGFDVVVLSRPAGGASAGHVGFFAGRADGTAAGRGVLLLGGNQSDSVGVQEFAASRVLGVRRLA